MQNDIYPDLSETWISRFLGLAEHVSQWSKDPSTKVGAVIAEPNTKIVRSLGYNGFPRGLDDDAERLNNREVKYQMVVHAEMNAVLNANKDVRGCYMFTTLPPCHDCTKFLIQAGIVRCYTYDGIPERWLKSFEMSKVMLREARIPVHIFNIAENKVTHIF